MENRKYSLLTALILLASVFYGCEPDDANKDYGFPKIYIPQATVTGLDNTYPIPNGPFGQNTSYTCYFEDGSLYIALGVVRAGVIADAQGFTVDLSVSRTGTDAKLDEYAEAGTPATELPASLCTIPDKIGVNPGENTGTCYMAVNLEELAKQQPSLVEGEKYKLLVMCLEISNPTCYELNDSNTSVVVVLDLNSSHWDTVAENLPESEVRVLFPSLTL